MMRSRLLPLVALAGLAAPVVGVSPASAAPPVFDEETVSFVNHIDDYCGVSGLSVVAAGTFHDSLKIRTTRSGVEYFLEHISVDQVVTGVATGVSVRIKTAYLSKDLKITDNGDGTTTIISLLTGPSSVYGPDGKAIARDPGQSRFKTVISDAGTPNDPTDDFEVSFERIKGSTGRTDDYCAAIVPVIG
jgi:hypothetical protein